MAAFADDEQTPRRRQPVAVRDVVARAIAALEQHRAPDALIDFPTWKALVGAGTARHAQPVALRHGELLIHAADSALLHELTLRAPSLLAELQQRMPKRGVRTLRVGLGQVQW